MGFMDRLLGNTSEQQIKKIRPLVKRINELEDSMQALTDEQERLTAELDAKTERWVYLTELKEKIDAQNG